MRRIAAIALALQLGGCSFIWVDKPEPGRPCTRRWAPPIADTVAASLPLLFSAALWNACLNPGPDTVEDICVVTIVYGVPLGLIGIIFAASAAQGYVYNALCPDTPAVRPNASLD